MTDADSDDAPDLPLAPRDDDPDDVLLRIAFDEVFVVEPNYAHWRLDRYLTQKIQRASRTQVGRFLRMGGTTCAGRPARASTRVRPGEEVRIRRTEVMDPDTPTLDAVEILFEDPELLILNKPPGMLVHRNAGEVSRTIDAWLDDRFPDVRISPVHRLDRETSGCLVCARGLPAIRQWREVFDASTARKEYLTVVLDPESTWLPGSTRDFDTPLGFDAASAVKLRVGRGDWFCCTHARCLARAGDLAWLAVTIDQGRQHQIRAHLFLHRTPVVGDKLYAHGDAFFLDWLDHPAAPRLVAQLTTRWHALHARQLTLHRPSGPLVVEAPVPAHMQALAGYPQAIAALRNPATF
jgi:23S rRNA pseudouridine1911/1915/1917 synthase